MIKEERNNQLRANYSHPPKTPQTRGVYSVMPNQSPRCGIHHDANGIIEGTEDAGDTTNFILSILQ